jgi:hypothetical protein
MLRWTSILLALAVAAASPAAAVPTPSDRPGAEIASDPLARIDADMVRYGAWLQRANEIEVRVQQQLTGMYPALQQMQASGGSLDERTGRFRAYIQRAVAEIDAADVEVGALELPRLTGLELPEDLRPATIVIEVRRLNRDIRALLDDFLPLIDAIHSNPQAIQAGATRLYANMRLVFESQIVLLRARQAATPRDDSTWEALSFELSFLRAAFRVFRAYDPFEPRVDRTLPDDLITLADELDGNLRQAREKLDAELAGFNRNLADAEQRGDETRVVALRRVVRVMATIGDYFPFVEQLSTHLREAAGLVRGRPLSQALLTRIFTPLRAVRAGFDQITQHQARLLADTN